jgi:hypothetical protein
MPDGAGAASSACAGAVTIEIPTASKAARAQVTLPFRQTIRDDATKEITPCTILALHNTKKL